MGISYVGGVQGGRAGSTSTTTQSLNGTLTGGSDTSPSAGDLVIVWCSVGTNSSYLASSQIVSGNNNGTYSYTTFQSQADTYYSQSQLNYKIQGATVDTSLTIPSSGSSRNAQRWIVHVFRGVSASSPFDVTPVPSSGDNTGRPNPTAITPSTAGAWIVAYYASAVATGIAYTSPGLSGWLGDTTADTYDVIQGGGYYSSWTSGEYDPPAITAGGTINTTDSWTGMTLALRVSEQNYDIAKSAAYAVARITDITKSAAYLVAEDNDVTKQAVYTVSAIADDITKQAAYTVQTDITPQKASEYVVALVATITKDAVYTAAAYVDIAKDASYKVQSTTFGPVLDQSQTITSYAYPLSASGAYYGHAQTFTASVSGDLYGLALRLSLYNSGNSSYPPVAVSVYSDGTTQPNTLLGTSTNSISAVRFDGTLSGDTVEEMFFFEDVTLAQGSVYWFLIEYTPSSLYAADIKGDSVDGGYAGGTAWEKNPSGVWVTHNDGNYKEDFYFKEYLYPFTDKIIVSDYYVESTPYDKNKSAKYVVISATDISKVVEYAVTNIVDVTKDIAYEVSTVTDYTVQKSTAYKVAYTPTAITQSAQYVVDAHIRYWRGNTGGDWGDVSNWSYEISGDTGAAVPTYKDAVIFGANAFGGNGYTVTTSLASIDCKSLDAGASNYAFTISRSSGGYATIHGNLTLRAGMTLVNTGWHFRADSGTYNLDFAGVVTDYEVKFDNETTYGSPTWQLSSDLVQNVTGIEVYVWHRNGTLKLNGYTIDCNNWYSSSTTTLDMGGTGTVKVNDYFLDIGIIPSYGGSIINQGTFVFAGSDRCGYNLAGYIQVNTTIGSDVNLGTLIIQSTTDGPLWINGHQLLADTITFYPDTYIKIDTGNDLIAASNWNFNGTNGHAVTIASGGSGTRYNLSKTDGSVTANYLTITDSNVVGGALWLKGVGFTGDNTLNEGWVEYVTDAKDANYCIRIISDVTKSAAYEVLASIDYTVQKSTAYTTIYTPSPIQQTAVYVVISSEDISKVAQYAVPHGYDLIKQSAYTVPTTATIDKAASYAVAHDETVTKGSLYAVAADNELIAQAQYYVLTVPAVIQKPSDYDVAVIQTIQKAIGYVVLHSTDLTQNSTYVVVSGEDITAVAQYQVPHIGDIQKSSQYTVPTQADVTKQISYAVAVSSDVDKSVSYTVPSSSDITKAAAYVAQTIGTMAVTKNAQYAIETIVFNTIQSEYTVAVERSIGGGEIVCDYYPESNYYTVTQLRNGSFVGVSQAFTGNGGILSKSTFYLNKTGSPVGNVVSKVYAITGTYGSSAKPTGAALATSQPVDASTLSTSRELIDFIFTGNVTLSNATYYAITVEFSGGSTGNTVEVSNDTSNPYTHSGNWGYKFGTTWMASSTGDAIFYVYTQDTGKIVSYCVEAEHTITKSAQYAVIGSDDISKIAQYVVQSVNGKTELTQYAVLAESAVTKSSQYIAQTNTDVTKSAAYVVVLDLDVQKSAQYVVISGDNITLVAQYSVSQDNSVTLQAAYEIIRITDIQLLAVYDVLHDYDVWDITKPVVYTTHSHVGEDDPIIITNPNRVLIIEDGQRSAWQFKVW